MKKLKRIELLMLTLVIAICFAGCGNSKKAEKPKPKPKPTYTAKQIMTKQQKNGVTATHKEAKMKILEIQPL